MRLKSKSIFTAGVNVLAIADPDTIDNLTVIQGYAAEVIDFYNSLLGFYPHQYLVIIPGSNTPDGGYPADTGLIAIHGANDLSKMTPDYWRWITAHEIAHMYWGFYVYDAERTTNNPLSWLTLGLGLYLDKKFVEQKNLSYSFHYDQVEAYRKAKMAGLPVAFGKDENEIGRMDFDYNTVVLHGRSYSIIEEIATLIGREKYDLVFRDTLKEYAHKPISFPLFRKFVMERTKIDIGSFVEEYMDT